MRRAARDVRTTVGFGDDRSVARVGRSRYHGFGVEAARIPDEGADPHGRLVRPIDERLIPFWRASHEGREHDARAPRHPYFAPALSSATNAIRSPRAFTASRVMPF